MNTFLSSAQQALKDQYQAFAREHVANNARALAQRSLNCKEFLQKLGQAGYLGITVPKEYGGQGGSFINTILFAEAVSEYEAGLSLTLAAHTAVIELLKKYGTDSQKSRYLPLLARGECIGATLFNEEQAGTDFKAAATVLTDNALTGKKTWVVNGDIAGLGVVLAKEGSADHARKLYLVDLAHADSLSISENRDKLGLRSASTNDIEFKAHKVQPDAVLAGADADEQVLYALDISKVIISAGAVGLVEGALAQSAQYANTREQFGEKIAQFQAIQWKLADISVEGQASRLLTYRAAWSKDEEPGQFHVHSAMCKWFAAKVARLQSGEALQIMGAHGISDQSPLERAYRDAKVMELCEGTSEWQKIVIAEELGV